MPLPRSRESAMGRGSVLPREHLAPRSPGILARVPLASVGAAPAGAL